MCMYCKNNTTVNSATTHVVNYKDCIIVIKNVPCLECEQCGEKYYTDEGADRLVDRYVVLYELKNGQLKRKAEHSE